MKIALVGNFASQGGANTLFRREAHVLARAGHETSILCDNFSFENKSIIKNYVIAPLHKKIESKKSYKQKIVSILNHISPDIIHLHLSTLLEDVTTILEFMEIAPIVITPHSHQFSCPSVKKIFTKPLVPCFDKWSIKCLIRPYTKHCNHRHPGKLLNSFRRFLANRKMAEKAYIGVTCNYMYKLISETGISKKKIKVLPPIVNAIDEEAFYEKNEPILLFAGALIQEKGVQYLLEASSRIKTPHKIYIAGDGWMAGKLKEMAKTISNGEIEFLGWVTEKKLIALYREATVNIMPSLCPETFGLSGIEALGCGTPVVAFDVGGISDWLADGRNGFLVPAGDVKELASKIEQLLYDPQLANEMGKNGIELVREKFSTENHLKNLLSIYEEAIATFR